MVIASFLHEWLHLANTTCFWQYVGCCIYTVFFFRYTEKIVYNLQSDIASKFHKSLQRNGKQHMKLNLI